VTTGHSLGAGAAAPVACRLRARGRAATCWAFCPPGGLATPPLAAAADDFCTSVAVGKDVIPRLSLAALDKLLDGVVVALARAARSGPATLASLACRHRSKPGWDDDLFMDADALPEAAAAALPAFRAAPSATPRGRTLEPLGRLLFVRRVKGRLPAATDAGGRELREAFDAVWAPRSALLAEGVLVSKRAVTDHLVSTLMVALEAAAAHAEEREARLAGGR